MFPEQGSRIREIQKGEATRFLISLRFHRIRPLLLQLITAAVVSAEVCPHTATLGNSPSDEYWLDGKSGIRHIRMYVERGGEGVVGVLYDTADWNPVLLGGQWRGIGEMELNVTTVDHGALGHLSGKLRSGRFAGVWNKADGSRERISLKVGAEPSHYDPYYASEPLRTFRDLRWPITFSYPAWWRLEVGESIILTDPDPIRMAIGNGQIEVVRNAVLSEGGVLKCGDKWEYGDSCEDCENASPDSALSCAPFKVTKRNGMTILNADAHEWRLYCIDGGYIGQGDGASRYIDIGDSSWINVSGNDSNVVELIAKSIARTP
jgi:hypothetical protein